VDLGKRGIVILIVIQTYRIMAEIKETDIEKIRYKVFSVRLSDESIEWIKLAQKKSGVSWNKFIIKLLKKWES